MEKLYELSELMDVNIKAYNTAISKLKKELGGTEQGVIRYCKQAGYMVDSNGVVYAPIN